jgi:hypothetical protein
VTTCRAHGWNDPCYRCTQDIRHETDRRKLVFVLGGLGMDVFGRVRARLERRGIPWKEGTRLAALAAAGGHLQ